MVKNTLVLIMLAICITACSTSYEFQKSSVVPAAEVDLKIDQDKNNNYVIKLDVENLAKPQDLTPSRSIYVAWVETEQGVYNIGKLVINKKLKGSLTGHTPYKPNRIKITAEDNPLATKPNTEVVLISNKMELE